MPKTKITVWTLTTCLPDEGQPQVVGVYASEKEALKAFDDAMRNEWGVNAPEDEETGVPQPYPGDPQEAHDEISAVRSFIEEDDLSEVWGRYSLDEHTVKVELP